MTFEGVVSSDEITRALDEFFDGIAYGTRINSLADLSGVTKWDVGVADLRLAAEIASKKLERVKTVRGAIVATSTEAFGMSRMFELTLDSTSGIEIKVFRSRSEAEQWLKSGRR